MREVGTTGPPGSPGRRLYFSAGGRIVVAETKGRTLLSSARQLFPAYEVAVPSRTPPGPPDLCLATERRRFVVTSRGAAPETWRSRMEAIVAFEFALSRSLADSLHEYVHLHASGAVVDGQAVLALGGSGAGKSSLAISMLAREHPTLGDDTVMLGSDASVSPFKRLLKVSPVVLEELGIDPADTVHWDPAWPEAWYEPPDPPGWADVAPVGAVVLVRYDPDSSLILNPAPASEALNAVLHSVMATGMPASEAFDRLLKMVNGAKAYRLTFNSAIEAAEILCCLTK